ncbi:tRNA glutamyl-Q(34) synthetase GluQRS [Shewanella sedimentimangrovi]|uniref:Glutamyl-Q tRNA(Asp) synthetase n=1 Tax=Shewanella sedimentimangrovi TaxID=2814293 RepID=A0ABX7QYH7_9GAMM|nr:tRNA glutamyl-Q(34) synthetase GluQRS [Shewanella sedimentimangrovi]QSX36504.1 tRNA glutamyl-Q(34) synthetase GluQRS [Shewanella sedimentimangrovi]
MSPIAASTPYIGRFAPSPSGALHFGSLIAALGSYLRARAMQGHWLLRIEDIDPPREVPGASDAILRTLEAFGLHWDGEVLYQSSRTEAYEERITQLLSAGEAYFCQCSRKQIQAAGGIYDGHCRDLGLTAGAIRIRNHAAVASFEDKLIGLVRVEPGFAGEDFIIKRSDGLYAYQLAVVMDDAMSGITEIVRGCDLIEASCRQLSLFRQFGAPEPDFLHLPLACAEPGFKLSKQNRAQPVDDDDPAPALLRALTFLGQAPVDSDSPERMLAQAVSQFTLDSIPRQREILLGS